MNVFVLSTGRCGSTTFERACSHITNYTAGHESRAGALGAERFRYPERHIESDNRLSWVLGRLDRAYGDRAFYVHLTREEGLVARSWARRAHAGIMSAYRHAILWHCPPQAQAMDVARDYVDTVGENIRLFLRDKRNRMDFRLEYAREDFTEFWRRIGAEGDLQAALAEFDVTHNAGWDRRPAAPPGLARRLGGKLYRLARKLPVFIRNA